jgi:hypothetical protein
VAKLLQQHCQPRSATNRDNLGLEHLLIGQLDDRHKLLD